MATQTIHESLLAEDPRYAEMFRVEREMANSGVDLTRDYTDDMNALRDKAPIHKGSLRELMGVPEIPGSYGNERPGYTFFSYRACEIGFRENLVFSSEGYNESPGVRTIGPTILSMVGRQHRRLRATAQPLFKRPRVIDWWNKRWIEETVDALLDRLQGNEAVDLNSELCARLPMATVTRAIGLEGTDSLAFRYHLTRSTFGARSLPPEESAQSREIVDQMLRDLIAQNLSEPGDNIITGLLENDLVLDDGSTRKLNEEELFGYCKLTIFAGGGTTWRQLGITIDALLNHYHFWEACRDDRNLIELAVDEGLRWRATDPIFPRLCTEDSEVEGIKVPAGSRVYLCLGAANHDPAVFERPEDYDIFRKKEHHMGFGFGPHRCLGMDVARQEMVVAINGLLDRWPNMRIDPDKPKPLYRGLDHRGMSAVTVRLN
jgi:cytochrome P450